MSIDSEWKYSKPTGKFVGHLSKHCNGTNITFLYNYYWTESHHNKCATCNKSFPEYMKSEWRLIRSKDPTVYRIIHNPDLYHFCITSYFCKRMYIKNNLLECKGCNKEFPEHIKTLLSLMS